MKQMRKTGNADGCRESAEIRKNKGITLVALVITIIVLIILASITLSFVFRENGVIKKAQEGKLNMTNATGEEKQALQNLDNLIGEYAGGENSGESGEEEIPDTMPPTIDSFTVTGVTGEGITVKVVANDTESGLKTEGAYTYWLENGEEVTVSEDTYTFHGLHPDTSYTIHVRVTDNSGKTVEANTTGKTDVAVAKIEYVTYPTVQEAFNAVPNDGTQTEVELLQNASESVTVDSGKAVVLDLATYTLTSSGTTITNQGTLGITNGTVNATAGATVANNGQLVVAENATLNCSATANQTIENNGSVVVKGTVTASQTNTIVNITAGSNLTIQENAQISNTSPENVQSPTIFSFGTIEMTGGTVTSQNMNCIYMVSGSQSTISGGSVLGTVGNAIYTQQNTTLNISGTAYIEGNGTPPISASGTVNMSGGTAKSPTGNVILAYPSAQINISGTAVLESTSQPTAEGTTHPVIFNYGTVTMTGGTVKTAGDVAINNGTQAGYTGTMTLSGGTITAPGVNVVVNAGNLTIEGTVSITGGASNMPVVVNLSGTLNVTGGTITNKDSSGDSIYKNGGTVTVSGGTQTPAYNG